MEKLTNKVSASLSSLDSEVEKCKSKPVVTFLLIILNFLCDCTNEKKENSKLTRTEKNTISCYYYQKNYIHQ